MTEVMTGVGAYEAIYAAITAFINEGDEVTSFYLSAFRNLHLQFYRGVFQVKQRKIFKMA